ncbi:flagellar biosynthesis protein FlgF [Zhengella mangrovi]|uniref:Flagellar biosynthesis protein FlgF n=1 Tax=Zhengella mangrovi TaxID=1982044 RepID=A0A2G1QJU6_9HYPH|nr:DUF1217 domain-containing protein [Zhengella mangrovi]PHP65734.1 flagellar biosynthesis protein FlgF [Zhengella mangrovi]
MLSTYVQYNMIAKNMDRSVEAVNRDPVVSRDTEYYLSHITEVNSVDEFVSDTRLFTYAMKAFGLSDMTFAKAFMTKVLDEGHDDKEAFVNQLADTRYVDFAKTFDFKRYGATATTFTRAQTGVVDKYVRQTLEENAGQTNDAVRLALYFERKAPEITSVTDILADKALFTVVRTNLGLPTSFSMLDIDRQISILKDKVDLKEFSDPEAVAKQIERFSAMWDAQNPDQTTASTIGLLFNNSASTGISSDLMMAIQTLKR